MPLWLLFGLLSALFAALVAVFGKIGLSGVDSVTATAVRSLFMTLVLLAALLCFGSWRSAQELFTTNRSGLLFVALSGLAGAASWLCYFYALKNGDVCRVAPIDKFSVVIASVLAIVFLGEKLSLLAGVGIALITAGIILVALG